ncbi:MAG: nicotinamide-nucleotide amidohydrolase family protein [Marinobacter sp.]|nr:nicotinamide-nucleotide amidohydrolase family protein [Marinobacter sp.]
MDDSQLSVLAAAVGDALRLRQLRLVTAESCTGGWIAKVMTDRAGSSTYLEGGIVTYSNAAKQRILGVTTDALERDGAVSERVVREMVAGALKISDAEVAVAVSGVAGPGGGSEQKLVGTVWVAWGRQGRAIQADMQRFPGNRDDVRRETVRYALAQLLDYLQATD